MDVPRYGDNVMSYIVDDRKKYWIIEMVSTNTAQL